MGPLATGASCLLNPSPGGVWRSSTPSQAHGAALSGTPREPPPRGLRRARGAGEPGRRRLALQHSDWRPARLVVASGACPQLGTPAGGGVHQCEFSRRTTRRHACCSAKAAKSPWQGALTAPHFAACLSPSPSPIVSLTLWRSATGLETPIWYISARTMLGPQNVGRSSTCGHIQDGHIVAEWRDRQ